MLFNILDKKSQVPDEVALDFMIREFNSLQAAQLFLCCQLKRWGVPIEEQEELVVPIEPSLIVFIRIKLEDYKITINGESFGRDSEEIQAAYQAEKYLECLRLIYIKLERDGAFGRLEALQNLIRKETR